MDLGEVRLYLALARMGFQKRLAYRAANVAGLITNAIFGFLRTSVFIALFAAQPVVATYTQSQMITYSWLMQVVLGIILFWGWFEVEETIRTGDVVADLSKPFSYLGYWLAQDLGRGLHTALYRGAPIFLLGHLTMGLDLPSSPLTWPLFLLTLLLGSIISFCCRFMLNLTAFWTTDARGFTNLGMGFITAMSGFIVPIPFFPEPLRTIVSALPFASMVQVPSDVFLERVTGAALAGLLLQQIAWVAVMLLSAHFLVAAATRRVVVQGG